MPEICSVLKLNCCCSEDWEKTSAGNMETPEGQTDGLVQRQAACQSRAGASWGPGGAGDSGVAASEGQHDVFLKVPNHESWSECCGGNNCQKTCIYRVKFTRWWFIRSVDANYDSIHKLKWMWFLAMKKRLHYVLVWYNVGNQTCPVSRHGSGDGSVYNAATCWYYTSSETKRRSQHVTLHVRVL